MELVKVDRLYVERPSRKCIVVLGGCETGARTRLVLPEREASVLALEAHGLNDRCGLYHVLTACVASLGGAFCRVVIELNARMEAVCHLTLLQGGVHKSLSVNVGEMLALAVHGGLPIYLDRYACDDQPGDGSADRSAGVSDVPPVFEALLSDLIGAEPADEA